MAARPPSQSPFGPGAYLSGGNTNNSMAVGNAAIARMAREDTRWFIVAVVILSLVLFLALPMSLLVLVETEKMKSDVRHEIRQLKKLREQLKEQNEKAAVVKPTSGPAGL